MTMSSATAASVTYDAAKRMKRGLYSPNRRSKAARSSISPEETDSIPISPFSSRGASPPLHRSGLRAPAGALRRLPTGCGCSDLMYYNTSAGKTPDATRHFFSDKCIKKRKKPPRKGAFPQIRSVCRPHGPPHSGSISPSTRSRRSGTCRRRGAGRAGRHPPSPRCSVGSGRPAR